MVDKKQERNRCHLNSPQYMVVFPKTTYERGTVAVVSRSGVSGDSSMVVAKRSAETFTEFNDAGRIADFATGTTINRTCYVAPVGP